MICEKNKCTGCFACKNICLHNAIEMKEDGYGHIYPNIDENKCTRCNLCKKICPSNKEVELTFPLNCYAMVAKSEEIHLSSTSGGAATVFSKYIIEEKKGCVYGSAYVDKKVRHIRIDNINDLNKLQGSKYVHSYVEDSYKKVKEDLKNELYVLFIGTPCQIAGLKKFLNKDYDKLYLIDLICHGVPSQKLLNEEIKNYNLNDEYSKISFRDRDKFELKLFNQNTLIIKKKMNESLYYMGFMNALFYRDSCYNCLYSKAERCSDITIGDFWGLDENAKIYENKDKGISVLLPCTNKGNELINFCEKQMILEKREVEEAIKGNAQLRYSSKPHIKRKYFINNYIKKGYKRTLNNIFIKSVIKNKIKKITPIYSVYKKMKGK